MLESKTELQARKRAGIPPAAMIVGAVLLIGLAGFWYLDHVSKQSAPGPPPLTGAAREYVKYLKFVDAGGHTAESPKMEAHESYFKQSVVEITGNILNAGDRIINSIEINCIFYDPGEPMPDGTFHQQVILRQRVPIITRKLGGLAPGEAKPFRIAFDNVPDSWNQAMPQMVIAGIDFR